MIALSTWTTPAAPPRTSLDPALQAAARRLLADARPVLGGIVALHVPSGRVLAWQEFQRSGPARHPNARAITPAASLFKIVTTVALFERAHIGPHSPVCISGGERGIERFHLAPPPPGDRDAICRPFEEALGFSRNAVFAQLATERLLRRDLIEVAEQLGFNRPLDFDAPAEMGVLDVPYNDLEFARTAAGFRGSRLSVLGAARLALLVASDGKPPRIGFDVDASAEGPAQNPESIAPMQANTARRLRRMLEFTVHSGTSLEAFSDPDGRSYLGGIRVAGKTGTLRPKVDAPTTSWFIGFAPSRAPELVVSVMLDNSPVWRRKANHVARDVFRAYFHAAPGVSHPFENDG
jgi:peptidoglycan glycosyltransferase